MRNVLLKTTAQKGSSDIREIEDFFNKHNFCLSIKDLNSNEKIQTEAAFCVLFIDFENKIECTKAKEFIKNNKELKIFAYLKNSTKKALINANNINCLGTHFVKINLHKKVNAELKVTLLGGES